MPILNLKYTLCFFLKQSAFSEPIKICRWMKLRCTTCMPLGVVTVHILFMLLCVCVCETDNPQEKKVSKSLFYRISFQGTEDKPY